MPSDAFLKDLNDAEAHVELTDVQRFRLRGMMMRLESEVRRETAREAWGWMKNRLRMYGHGGEAEEMVRDFGADFGLEDGDETQDPS